METKQQYRCDNNRKYHAIAHNKLIEYIQYKALLVGIVVLTTEESYTSKTSFINHSELKSYSKNKNVINNKINKEKTIIKEKIKFNKGDIKNKSKSGKIISNPIPSTTSKPESKLNSNLGGVRKSRGIYVNYANNNKSIMIHADINGSYNIMRKVFNKI